MDNFLREQLFSDANRFAKLFGVETESPSQGATGESSSPSSSSPVLTSRNDEASCPNNDCWTHFGKEAFWNGSSQIGGRAVPKITIQKSPTSFLINYDGPASGFLLKHAKGGKGDTIHQLLNVLTLELNEYLKTLSVKPDVKNIKMEMIGNKLSVNVPLVRVPAGTHYLIARRGGLGHGGDFTGLMKYKRMEGYEEAKHKTGRLTEKFVTVILK
ncbi:MAG: hypothetical protein EBS19_10735 [Spirochaetia bacterium]|nr:hypothetical protein [Spirochaetia bacterium]